jgi:ferredoxin
MVDYMLFDGDDIIYLPMDTTIPVNVNIATPEEIVLPSQVVEHFIQEASQRWLMDFCICRDGNHCRDYPPEYGCLFLGDAVLDINPKFGRLVSEEEALDHARRCREAGLVHMVGRNKIDTIWLGVKPGTKLLTICNCCPCCCLWRVLPYMNEGISRKISRMPGVTVSVNGNCAGCGTCAEEGVCFVNAVDLVEGYATISVDCRGCGRCVEVCPNQAIELTVRDNSFVGETIERLTSVVDVK